jgi:hypothetical protein
MKDEGSIWPQVDNTSVFNHRLLHWLLIDNKYILCGEAFNPPGSCLPAETSVMPGDAGIAFHDNIVRAFSTNRGLRFSDLESQPRKRTR